MAATVVATLASGTNALKDLRVFLYTLGLFNSVLPKVYLLCDTYIANNLPAYSGTIITDNCLDEYTTLNRMAMECMHGKKYRTLWEDFMMEKTTVMDKAFQDKNTAVFFFDDDICFMGPLPTISPTVKLGISPHMIISSDEQKYGTYNAGFIYSTDPSMPELWRNCAKISRYYDQAALEDIEKQYATDEVYHFPIQNNYGWWRMFQSTSSSETIMNNWEIHGEDNYSGIKAHGQLLCSIHTHWGETNNQTILAYNQFVYQQLIKLNQHKPAQMLRDFLTNEFPHLKTI